jgi:zinc transport system substrate-binding protein
MRIVDVQMEVARIYPARYFAPNDQDPHIWLSPRRFAGIATNTACALATLMPSQASDLSNRLMRVTQTIHAVEQQAQKKLAPFAGMLWVVYHPSWRYFASDYNLHILTVELDGKSPSSRHIITIVKQARAAHVKAVFTEPQYDKRYAHAVADPLNARVEVIDPLQEDWPLLMQTLLEKLTQ